ncbi:hypothetical protein Sjap_010477 [Stephania japonica]|uniref:Uncharacterized protein n=1 Tax=Stephania japonica TaxID=461633 RepID=A0AAP0JB99_9MAGN
MFDFVGGFLYCEWQELTVDRFSTNTNKATATPTPTATQTTPHLLFLERASPADLRNSLPENPNIYDFSEIRKATNNFLICHPRYPPPPSSSSCFEALSNTGIKLVPANLEHQGQKTKRNHELG